VTSEASQTGRSYGRGAAAYAARTATVPDAVRAALEHLAARLGPGARVIEIGSGGGRDALLMEQLGLAVRRTDVTPAFVTLLREHGHACDRLDPLVDDLASPDGPYDAVWANASLLHVARAPGPSRSARCSRAARTDSGTAAVREAYAAASRS